MSEQDQCIRQKGLSIVKPIVYGNISQYFGKKREEDGHTHQWTVYVKPYRNEDMSLYVKKMNFKLHESYTNHNRVITKPPYEVSETGWGEFEVVIRIYFHDPNEKAVTIYHLLKLFHTEADIMSGKKNLVNEIYDELIFQDPSVAMQQVLTQQKQICPTGTYKHDTDFEEKQRKHSEMIEAAHVKVREEIEQLTEKLKQSKEEIQRFKDEIGQLEGEGGAVSIGGRGSEIS